MSAIYRRTRPREIKLQLKHYGDITEVDLPAALTDLLNSFDAPMPNNARPMLNNQVYISTTREIITRRELNKRYLMLILEQMQT